MARIRPVKRFFGTEFGKSITRGFASAVRHGKLFSVSTRYELDPDRVNEEDPTNIVKVRAEWPMQGFATPYVDRFDDSTIPNTYYELTMLTGNMTHVPEVNDEVELDDLEGEIVEILSATPDDSLYKVKVKLHTE